jgi:predicted nucleotidyltransferase
MSEPATDSHGLSSHQRTVADRVIAEEEAKREHLVVYLSGAHAYGFPSPDSDLDLKAIHVAPTAALVGFDPPEPTSERTEIVEGVEIDYTSNEIAHVLGGVLSGNGNFLERILGRCVLASGPLLEELRPLVQATLSQRVHRHYRGFAQNQDKLLAKDPTVKKLLYVLRTALTGTHLLRTGEMETNLERLAEAYEVKDVRGLVAQKRAGEHTTADPDLVADWQPEIASVLARLDAARARSVLPEEPRGHDVTALEAWLVAVRKRRFS